ncbi:hypothetical protein [Streptomyces tirandamycinicus]|uniref:Uncharacterized protein n=1 Tax=Streptomyces tirandamycinicus TaxID=2174846 RepID=A0A2S1T1X7_9ACTN|nr:hypothetical protein [Streptomyces tirandamycinicus]AWI32631.1 hypothetical protein DDW44_30395 [Streptomyces tirandamycinicus]
MNHHPHPGFICVPIGSDMSGTKVNAALADEVKQLRAEVARLRAGEEPIEPYEEMTSGGHLLWALGHAPAEIRLSVANGLVHSMNTAHRCGMENHQATIALNRRRIERLEAMRDRLHHEAKRQSQKGGPEARAVGLALSFVLAYDTDPVTVL